MPRADLLKKEAGDIPPEAVTEAVKERLEVKRAESSSKVAVQNVVFNGFFPTDENQETAFDAAKHLEVARAAEEERRNKAREVDKSEYVYFLRCRQYNAHQKDWSTHGLYFTERPEGVVSDKDWYSGYKKQPEVWRNAIYCQVCLRAGREVELPVEMVNWRRGEWRPDQRWTMKVPRDPERARIEGETRAFPMPGEANNIHLDEAKARWEAHLAKKKLEVSRG